MRRCDRAVPDEVIAAPARRGHIAPPRHQISKQHLARRQTEGHAIDEVAFGRIAQGGFFKQSAPRHITCISRLRLRRELRAHARTDAVGADQQVAVCLRPVGEKCSDTVVILLKSLERTVVVITLCRKHILQQAVEPPPRRQRLLQRHFGQQPALRIERGARERVAAQRFVNDRAGAANRIEQFVMRDDAGAAIGKRFADALKDFDVPTRAQQQVGGKQTAEGTADDERLAPVSHGPRAPFRPSDSSVR